MDVKERIIKTSTELFLESGIKTITMDDVARNLGMSKRTIYEIFENKGSLVSSCVDYIHDQKRDQELELIGRSANIVEELITLLRPIEMGTRRRERRFAMELKKYFPDIFQEQYVKRYEDGAKQMGDRLQRGIEQGIILPDTNVSFSVLVIFETIYSLVSRPDRLLLTNTNMDDAFRYVFVSFFRGIATQKGIEMIDKVIK